MCDTLAFELETDRADQLVGKQTQVQVRHGCVVRLMEYRSQGQVTFQASESGLDFPYGIINFPHCFLVLVRQGGAHKILPMPFNGFRAGPLSGYAGIDDHHLFTPAVFSPVGLEFLQHLFQVGRIRHVPREDPGFFHEAFRVDHRG